MVGCTVVGTAGLCLSIKLDLVFVSVPSTVMYRTWYLVRIVIAVVRVLLQLPPFPTSDPADAFLSRKELLGAFWSHFQ